MAPTRIILLIALTVAMNSKLVSALNSLHNYFCGATVANL